jgi:chromate transporter
MTAAHQGQFLRDVFICSMGAFGGPEAHYGIFLEQLVVQKKYLREEELLELIALTALLPGPSSTQTITAIGYRVGGVRLAIATLVVWALPAILLLGGLGIILSNFSSFNVNIRFLRYLAPMAVAFMGVAAYRLAKKVITQRWMFLWFLNAFVISYSLRSAPAFLSVLVIGALIGVAMDKPPLPVFALRLNPPWRYLSGFVGVALLSTWLISSASPLMFQLFERFYRFGYLVIGGGQVVIPYMYSELVEQLGYLSHEAFLEGFGLVQGMPGPMFSFSAYVGAYSAQSLGLATQIGAAIVSGLGIFLPGTLLILFVLPLWEALRQQPLFTTALRGVSISATALIAASALVFFQRNGFGFDVMGVTALSAVVLLSKKVWIPTLVFGMMVLGWF